ncbi:hypothetical protein PG593_11060 [Riemerella anatipestifer]|nr:hypothetical protein [Riemerella anatipestifer]
MEMTLIIEFTILLVGIILFFTIKNFLPSYFNEKGKNLATKEDLEEITEKVEKIKAEFIKDIEYIKADLTYINQNKFSLKAAERDALIDTNNKYSEWLNYLMNISFSDINPNNYGKLNDYYKEMKVKKLNFDIAQDNLHLFLHDEELMEKKMKCVLETINLQHIINKTLINFIEHFDTRNLYFNGLMNLPKEQKPNEEFIQKQMEDFQKSLDEIFYKMDIEKSQQFSKVHENRVRFVTALKERLYNIME